MGDSSPESPPQADGRSEIKNILREHSRTFALIPYKLMVSWNGVLVVAFKGWPESVLNLKSKLNESELLVKENPGSMWPKCTIGCLKDRKRLKYEELVKLNELCEEFNNEELRSEEMRKRLYFRKLNITVYESRSHERVLVSEKIAATVYRDLGKGKNKKKKRLEKFPFGPPELSFDSCVYQSEEERVKGIYFETLDPETYWFNASKDGNREKHYREPKIGSSIVAWIREAEAWNTSFTSFRADEWHLTRALKGFEDKVKRALPGLYCFFDQESLHVTIRAIT